MENVCFSNDDRACRPTVLKTVSTTDPKFQNIYFKEHQ